MRHSGLAPSKCKREGWGDNSRWPLCAYPPGTIIEKNSKMNNSTLKETMRSGGVYSGLWSSYTAPGWEACSASPLRAITLLAMSLDCQGQSHTGRGKNYRNRNRTISAFSEQPEGKDHPEASTTRRPSFSFQHHLSLSQNESSTAFPNQMKLRGCDRGHNVLNLATVFLYYGIS